MFTPREIRDTEFDRVSRGYKIEDVDGFLSHIADQIEKLIDEKNQAESKMQLLANKIEEYRDQEGALRSALISAERMKESILTDAEQQREILVRDAAQKAEKLVSDAENRIEREELTLKALKQQVTKFKNEILGTYKRHLELLSELPEVPVDPEFDDAKVAELFSHSKEGLIPDEPVEKAAEEPAVEEEIVETLETANEQPAAPMNMFDGMASTAQAHEEKAPEAPRANNDLFSSFGEAKKEESRFGKLDFGESFSFGRD